MNRHISAIVTVPDWYEPDAIGQAIRAGSTLYVSDQASIDERETTVSEDFETQMRAAVAKLERVLAAAGATLRDIVTVTIMVTDKGDLDSEIPTSARTSHGPIRSAAPPRPRRGGVPPLGPRTPADSEPLR